MNLRGFPQRTLRGDRPIYRIHRAARAPWWFSADGSGRFDPLDAPGLGACYLAEKPLGAWVEVFRKPLLIAEADITARRVFEVEFGRSLKLADLTSRRALAFGVTASLGADEAYTASQHFASEAATAGYDGIRYFVRHDPAQRLYGLALFAAAGERDWPPGHDHPIPRELIEDAKRLFGYEVRATP